MAKSISILIPAYNAEKFIEQCLVSIACQTFVDYEIIVSNDGSSDGTVDTVKKFVADYPEVDLTLISNPNGGVSLARKRALEKATGEWVTFVDADDTIPSNALANLYSLADDDTDLVVGFLTPATTDIDALDSPCLWQSAVLQGTIPPSVWGKLYRRSVLSPFMLDVPRNITNGEDALMNIAYCFAMTKPPKFIYTRIYNYIRQPFSLSHTTKRNLDYEYAYDALRMKAIPESRQSEFMLSVTKYRLNGLLGCSRSDAVTIAGKNHPFFDVVRKGIKQSGYRLSMFEWIVLNIKSPFIIKYSGLLRAVFISLNYRLSLLLRKK